MAQILLPVVVRQASGRVPRPIPQVHPTDRSEFFSSRGLFAFHNTKKILKQNNQARLLCQLF
jgi:hypothetical protein